MSSLFTPPRSYQPEQGEFQETLLRARGPLRVERIISYGHTTAPGSWYDQDEDEWVVVLEGAARICFDDGREISLGKGEQLFIRRHERHRVSFTSSPCVWLTIFGAALERENPQP